MSLENKRESKQSTGGRRTEIQSLYEQCKRNERQVTRSSYEKLNNLLVEELAFGKPVIPSSLTGDRWRYAYLLTLLRKARDTDTKWYILANWLKHENVCRPREFLPQQVFVRLTAGDNRRAGRVGWNDFYYASMIQAWLPYCQSLLEDIKATAHGSKNQATHLQELGYDPGLVIRALPGVPGTRPRRSAMELACEWLAQRGTVVAAKKRRDPDLPKTLRNAYSRVMRYFRCAFCNKLATGKLLAGRSAFASTCEDHTADQLPTSSRRGWHDRYGRHWWLSGGEIRCSVILPAKED